jgi:hypothetical protein
MIHDDFYWDELPPDVLICFDGLPSSVRRLFAEQLKPHENPQAYCKERIKRLKSAGWSIEDMVDLARACPHGFGKFYINTWPVFAAILEELREDRRARRSKIGDRRSPKSAAKRKAPRSE